MIRERELQALRTAARALTGAAALAALAGSGVARADDDPAMVGVALTGGLSGPGVDLAAHISSYVGARATFSDISLSHNGQYGTSVNWNATLKLQQAGVLLDVYPFAGSFRISAGAIKDNNKVTMNGQPAGSSFTFNGNSYPSADVASVAGSADWGKTVPYAGLGFGNLAGSKGFHFTAELGVLFSGNAQVAITPACTAAGAALCTSGSTFLADVAQEQAKLQNDANRLRVWPVLRFGVGYAF